MFSIFSSHQTQGWISISSLTMTNQSLRFPRGAAAPHGNAAAFMRLSKRGNLWPRLPPTGFILLLLKVTITSQEVCVGVLRWSPV